MVLLAVLLAGCERTSPLVGVWKGTDREGKEVTIEFRPDGTFQAETGGDTVQGNFQADFSLTPVELDLRVKDTKPLLTIVKLEGDKLTIQRTGPGLSRPTGFSADSTVYSRQE
ncbi:MAG: hypothetical protein AB7S38_09420 [Vulcanimicrobiota bacterium]